MRTKPNVVLILLFILAGALLLPLTDCSNSPAQITTGTAATATPGKTTVPVPSATLDPVIKPENWGTFTVSDNTYSIRYPDNWVIREEIKGKLTIINSPGGEILLGITHYETLNKFVPFVEAEIEGSGKEFSDYQVISRRDLDWQDTFRAVQLTESYSHSIEKQIQMEKRTTLYLEYNNYTIYKIIGIAETKVYDNYLSIIDTIINSFHIFIK